MLGIYIGNGSIQFPISHQGKNIDPPKTTITVPCHSTPIDLPPQHLISFSRVFFFLLFLSVKNPGCSNSVILYIYRKECKCATPIDTQTLSYSRRRCACACACACVCVCVYIYAKLILPAAACLSCLHSTRGPWIRRSPPIVRGF